MPSRSNWIESHTDLRNHPKLLSTAAELGISTAAMCGHLHFLWHWCIDYQDDGDVTRYSDKILADAACFEGDCNAFVTALRNGYWLDPGPKKVIHNWPEYAGKLLRQREATRARVARFRENTQCNAVTVPNRTVPNQIPPVSSRRPPRGAFVPPTAEEVMEYFLTKNVNGNQHLRFHAYYSSVGWKVGKNPMKNWKAAAAGWLMRKEEA